jgi:hypothetical protein
VGPMARDRHGDRFHSLDIGLQLRDAAPAFRQGRPIDAMGYDMGHDREEEDQAQWDLRSPESRQSALRATTIGHPLEHKDRTVQDMLITTPHHHRCRLRHGASTGNGCATTELTRASTPFAFPIPGSQPVSHVMESPLPAQAWGFGLMITRQCWLSHLTIRKRRFGALNQSKQTNVRGPCFSAQCGCRGHQSSSIPPMADENVAVAQYDHHSGITNDHHRVRQRAHPYQGDCHVENHPLSQPVHAIDHLLIGASSRAHRVRECDPPCPDGDAYALSATMYALECLQDAHRTAAHDMVQADVYRDRRQLVLMAHFGHQAYPMTPREHIAIDLFIATSRPVTKRMIHRLHQALVVGLTAVRPFFTDPRSLDAADDLGVGRSGIGTPEPSDAAGSRRCDCREPEHLAEWLVHGT